MKYEFSGTCKSTFAKNRVVTVIRPGRLLLSSRKRKFHAFLCADENRIPRAVVRRTRIRSPVSLFSVIWTFAGDTGVINRICKHRISDHGGIHQFQTQTAREKDTQPRRL